MDPSSDVKPSLKSGSGGSIINNDTDNSINSGNLFKNLHNSSNNNNSNSLLPPPSTTISLLHNAQDDSDFDEESVPLLQLSQLNSNNNSNSSTNSNSTTNSNNNIKLQRQQKKRRERAQRLQAERTVGSFSNQTPINLQSDNNNKTGYRSSNDLISNAITSATAAVTGAIGVPTTPPPNFKLKSAPMNSSTITSADVATIALNNCSLNSGTNNQSEPILNDTVTPNGNNNIILTSFNNNNNNSKLISNNINNNSSSSITTTSTSSSVLLPAPNSIHNTNNINSSNDLIMLQTPASILANQLLHPQPISLTTGVVVGMDEDDEDDESVDEDLLSTSSSSTLLLPREKMPTTRIPPSRNNFIIGRKNQATPVKNLGFISPDSPVLEEDVIDGFSILAFKSYEDLEYAVKFAQKKKEKRLSAIEELTSSYCIEEKSPKIIELGPHHNNREKDMRDREREWNEFQHNNNNNNNSNNNQIQQQSHLLVNNNDDNNNNINNNNSDNNTISNNIINNDNSDNSTINNDNGDNNTINNDNNTINNNNSNNNHNNDNNINNNICVDISGNINKDSISNNADNCNNNINSNSDNNNTSSSNNNNNINNNNNNNNNRNKNNKNSSDSESTEKNNQTNINVNENDSLNNVNNNASNVNSINNLNTFLNSANCNNNSNNNNVNSVNNNVSLNSLNSSDVNINKSNYNKPNSNINNVNIINNNAKSINQIATNSNKISGSNSNENVLTQNTTMLNQNPSRNSHTPIQDNGTSDDSGRASERLTTSSVAPRDTDCSRDRLSDASSRCSSEKGYICDSEGDDDKVSDGGPVVFPTTPTQITSNATPSPTTPGKSSEFQNTEVPIVNGPLGDRASPVPAASQISVPSAIPAPSSAPTALPPPNVPPSFTTQMQLANGPVTTQLPSISGTSQTNSNSNLAKLIQNVATTNSVNSSVSCTNISSNLPPSHFNQTHTVPPPSSSTPLTTTGPIINNTLSLSSSTISNTGKQITTNILSNPIVQHQQQQSFVGTISNLSCSPLSTLANGFSVSMSPTITTSHPITSSRISTVSPQAITCMASSSTNSNQIVSSTSMINGSIPVNSISPSISSIGSSTTTVSATSIITSGQVLPQTLDISLSTSQINNTVTTSNPCVLSSGQSSQHFDDGTTSQHNSSIVHNGNNLTAASYRSPYPNYPLYTPYGDYRHNPYLPPSVPSPSASPRNIDSRSITNVTNSRGESPLIAKSTVRPLTPLNNVNSNIASNILNSGNSINTNCNMANSNNINISGSTNIGLSQLTSSIMTQLNPVLREHSSHHANNSQMQHTPVQYSQSQRSQIHHHHQQPSIGMQSSTGNFAPITSCSQNTSSSSSTSSVIPRSHSPKGHSPNRERESYGSSVSSLSRSSNTPSIGVPYSSAPTGPSPSLPYSTSTHGNTNSSPLPPTSGSGTSASLHYSKNSGWVSATSTPPVVTNTVTRPTPPPVSCVSMSPHHSICSVPSSTINTSSGASHSNYQQTIFATPLPPTAPIVSSSTASTTTPHPFSAESLLNNKTDQADLLRRELDSRFLDRSGLTVQSGPYLRQELHHHQHQHTHLHQHQQILPSAPPSSAPIFPPPLFKDLPKIGAVDSPFYRTGLGLPSYPGYSPSLLHPAGLGGPTPFVPPNHLPSFAPKQQNPNADPIKPQVMKTGRWNAMHVRIAWQIYKDQNEKQNSDKSANTSVIGAAGSSSSINTATTSLKPPTSAMDMLRPSTHMFSSSATPLSSLSRPHELPSTAYPGTLPGRSPYDTAPLPPTLFGASHLASPFTRYGPPPFSSPFSLSPFTRDIPIGTPLHDPWRSSLSRTVAGYTSTPGQQAWPAIKSDPAIDAARREAEEREREREIREREHRERERQRQREREERERKEKEEKLKREQQEREARERERERKERERREIERREIAERERLLQQQRLNESTKLAAAQAAAVAARERSPLRNGTDPNDIRNDIRIKEEIPRKEDQELLMRSAAAAAAAADPRYHPSSAALAVAQAQAHHQFMTSRHGPHVLPPPPHLSRSMIPSAMGGPPLSHFGPPTGHPGWSLDPYRDPYGQMLRYNPLMEVIRVEEERKALSMHAAYSAAMRGKEPSPVPPPGGSSQPSQHRMSGINVMSVAPQAQSVGPSQSGTSQALKSGPQSMPSIQHGIPQHNMTVSVDIHKKDDSSAR